MGETGGRRVVYAPGLGESGYAPELDIAMTIHVLPSHFHNIGRAVIFYRAKPPGSNWPA